VTAKDHGLPPDNFQEDPRPVIAHRTSPTNIGLYLLCAVSARDFGWLGTVEAIERLEATLATLQRLQRFRGHFYNWYDTANLRALDPQYVSSVDSGNLAAHLIAVANACREWIGAPNANENFISGVKDAMHLARAALKILPDDRRTQITTHRQLEDGLNAIAGLLDIDAIRTRGATSLIDLPALVTLAANFVDGVRAMAGEHGDTYQDLLFWSEALRGSIEGWRLSARFGTQTTRNRLSRGRRDARLELLRFTCL
jgi:cyclic beta-1,2-glucan synthetase